MLTTTARQNIDFRKSYISKDTSHMCTLDVEIINKVAPVRGVLEILHGKYKEHKPTRKEFSKMVVAFYYEGGALCGGTICAWCLQAIPTPKSLATAGASTYEHKHPITRSEQRCKCVNFGGATRSLFQWSQSLFFITVDQYKKHSALGQSLKTRNDAIIIAAFSYFSSEYTKYHSVVADSLLSMVVRYCTTLTTVGLFCDLCKNRRVDINLYINHVDEYYNRFCRGETIHALSIQDRDLIARKCASVLKEGKVACADCMYSLIRPSVTAPVRNTIAQSCLMETTESRSEWETLTKELDDALAEFSASDPFGNPL